MKDANTYYLTENNYIAKFDEDEKCCQIYYEDGYPAYYFDYDNLNQAKADIAKEDNGWYGKITKELGKYDSIEQCVAVNYPEHSMIEAYVIFNNAEERFFFLNDENSIIEISHITDGDEAHPYWNGLIPGNYTTHDEKYGECMSPETADEITKRISAILYDKMQIEDHISIRAIDRQPIPWGKDVSFPGSGVFEDLKFNLSYEETAQLSPDNVLGYKSLSLAKTLEFCEQNNIKLDDIVAVKPLDKGFVILENSRLDVYGEKLSELTENEKEIYMNEAISMIEAYNKDEVFIYSVYDAKGNLEFSEIDYEGKNGAQKLIDGCKCYLGQYENIDECREEWADTIKREQQKDKNKDNGIEH
jgi:hypothetical protein